MGLQSLVIREVSKNKDLTSSYFTSAMLIGVISSTIAIILLNLAKPYFDISPEISKLLSICSFTILPSVLTSIVESIFMAFEKMELIFFEQISTSFAKILLALPLIFLGYGLTAVFIALLMTSFVSLFLSFFLYHKYLNSINFDFNFDTAFYLLKHSLTFLTISIIFILQWRIDVVMLKKLTTLIEVAMYSLAFKLFEALMIFPQVYMKSCFPQMAILNSTNKEDFRLLSSNIIRQVSFYTFAVVSVTFLLAYFPINILYGKDYSQSVTILKILTLGLIPWSFSRAFAHILIASNYQRLDLVANVIATFINILLNFILIPKYGGVGAAFATLSSFSCFFIFEYLFVNQKVFKINLFRNIGSPIAVSAILFSVIYLATVHKGVLYFELLTFLVIVIFSAFNYKVLFRFISNRIQLNSFN